jgi:hypothetical protein
MLPTVATTRLRIARALRSTFRCRLAATLGVSGPTWLTLLGPIGLEIGRVAGSVECVAVVLHESLANVRTEGCINQIWVPFSEPE